MTDQNYFAKVASASTAPANTLSGQWSSWRSNLGTIALLGNHVTKIENLIATSEGDQVVHPHTTIPIDIRPSEWLNSLLLPDLQSEQHRLLQEYQENHAQEGAREEGRLAEECNAHGDVCRSLAESFKIQREQMNQSLPRPTPSTRTSNAHVASLNSLLKAMTTGDGLVDANTQQTVRQQQQQALIQQYQQLNAAKAQAIQQQQQQLQQQANPKNAASQQASTQQHQQAQPTQGQQQPQQQPPQQTQQSLQQPASMGATHPKMAPTHPHPMHLAAPSTAPKAGAPPKMANPAIARTAPGVQQQPQQQQPFLNHSVAAHPTSSAAHEYASQAPVRQVQLSNVGVPRPPSYIPSASYTPGQLPMNSSQIPSSNPQLQGFGPVPGAPSNIYRAAQPQAKR